jgi:hypothetical protein
MFGLREDYRAQTRRVKAGNSNRKGAVTAEQARIGKEYVFNLNPEWIKWLDLLRKYRHTRVRINNKTIRKRKRW